VKGEFEHGREGRARRESQVSICNHFFENRLKGTISFDFSFTFENLNLEKNRRENMLEKWAGEPFLRKNSTKDSLFASFCCLKGMLLRLKSMPFDE